MPCAPTHKFRIWDDLFFVFPNLGFSKKLPLQRTFQHL